MFITYRGRIRRSVRGRYSINTINMWIFPTMIRPHLITFTGVYAGPQPAPTLEHISLFLYLANSQWLKQTNPVTKQVKLWTPDTESLTGLFRSDRLGLQIMEWKKLSQQPKGITESSWMASIPLLTPGRCGLQNVNDYRTSTCTISSTDSLLDDLNTFYTSLWDLQPHHREEAHTPLIPTIRLIRTSTQSPEEHQPPQGTWTRQHPWAGSQSMCQRAGWCSHLHLQLFPQTQHCSLLLQDHNHRPLPKNSSPTPEWLQASSTHSDHHEVFW